MIFFRKATIKRKQVLIIMVVTTVALLLACAGFVTYDVLTFRADMVRNLSSLAEIIGHNTSGALDFNDPKAAQETLSALKAESHIVGACLYAADGTMFATYRRSEAGGSFAAPAKPPTQEHAFRNGDLTLSRAVISKGDSVGTVYLVSDIGELYARLGQYAMIITVVFVLTLIVALALSRKLQHFISDPILQLARAARAAGQNKDYSIRVEKQNPDEIGVLIDGFNGMLEQIQERNAELQKAKDVLEIRVQERTAELAATNAALQLENLERKQAEQALRTEEERTRSIVDQAFDAVITTDDNYNVIGWNRQAERVLGWARADILGRHLIDTIVPPNRRERHRSDLERFRETGAWADLNRLLQTTALHRAGHELPVDLTITPIRLGASFIFTIFLRDITERKKAEAELEAAHVQLVTISRQAGMAEVATSVLHNVGNVLNSINVAATLIEERVRKSRVADLQRLARLIEEHAEDRAVFLTSDPRGRKLPSFLSHLADKLGSEQSASFQEMTSLRKNVEHVKEIIAMQQSYARVSGVFENFKLADLLEDALRMNAASFARHQIEVVREYGRLPSVCTDRHKVLQILINLVRNAKYACDESGRSKKRVILRATNAQGRVSIAVEDNGIGIPPENLTRIFNHGFTTRKDGHGFGLHSGALAAKELGGSLSVQSDGPRKGAVFILDLPCQPLGDKQTKIVPDRPQNFS